MLYHKTTPFSPLSPFPRFILWCWWKSPILPSTTHARTNITHKGIYQWWREEEQTTSASTSLYNSVLPAPFFPPFLSLQLFYFHFHFLSSLLHRHTNNMFVCFLLPLLASLPCHPPIRTLNSHKHPRFFISSLFSFTTTTFLRKFLYFCSSLSMPFIIFRFFAIAQIYAIKLSTATLECTTSKNCSVSNTSAQCPSSRRWAN